MVTKILFALCFLFYGFMVMPQLSNNDFIQIIISLAIPALLGYYAGAMVHKHIKQNHIDPSDTNGLNAIPLRRIATYVGSIAFGIIGINLLVNSEMGLVYGPMVFITGTIASFIIGVVAEKIIKKA